jgi:hypothetical protein
VSNDVRQMQATMRNRALTRAAYGGSARASSRTGSTASDVEGEETLRDTIPLWLAASVTVVVALPFSLWLGNYSLPIWVSFIVWAQYFVLGAKPAVLRTIVPAFLLGVMGATALVTAYSLAAATLVDLGVVAANDVAMFLVFFVGFCALIYGMRFAPITQRGTLPFFNGVSMMLAVYFTGAFADAAPAGINAHLLPAVAGLGAVLAGLLGAFLGWFNVALMFRRPDGGALSSRP